VIDTHYHLEAAKDPARVAAQLESSRVMTVAVTSLPSIYSRMRPYVRRYSFIRLALGMHPLLASEHADEVRKFGELVETTSYIGEIGLDFSKQGRPTREVQRSVFNSILEALVGRRKFITLHSRGADSEVLERLREKRIGPAVFHWFSGPPAIIDEVIRVGHYCSVNPAMVRSIHGRQLISRIPLERILAETDGPYVSIGRRPAAPPDAALVVDYIASATGVMREAVSDQITVNFKRLVGSIMTP
jgi:TatD DNase family protein